MVDCQEGGAEEEGAAGGEIDVAWRAGREPARHATVEPPLERGVEGTDLADLYARRPAEGTFDR
jgi:hypothetical protein